jgi:probable HAF family extracellular repeat protein
MAIGGLLAATRSANAAAYTFTEFDVPGAFSTFPSGINDAGQIVGGYTLPGSLGHGFLYMNGTFTFQPAFAEIP